MVKYICYKLQSFSMMTLKYLMCFTQGEQRQCKCKRAALFIVWCTSNTVHVWLQPLILFLIFFIFLLTE